MNDWKANYEDDAAVRQLVADMVERDTVEGMEQYTRMFASMVGLKVFEDWPPSERLRTYLDNPPIDVATLQVPPDRAGVYPQWAKLAEIDRGYYQDRVDDFVKLIHQETKKQT